MAGRAPNVEETEMRSFITLVALAALLPVAFSAQAGTVTTNDYSATSTSSDINKSCKDLDLSSSGTLTGTCNGSTTQASLNMNDYADCKGGTLRWFTGTDPDGSTGIVGSTLQNYRAAADIDLSTNGKAYLLSGTCSDTQGVTDAAEDNLTLGDRLKNSLGNFKYQSSR